MNGFGTGVRRDSSAGVNGLESGEVVRTASSVSTSAEEAAYRIRAVFARCGARGFVHAAALDGGGELEVDADEPVVLASVFKIPIALAYARAVHAGELDPAEPANVTARDRLGGTGVAGCADDARLSWRDLALFMLSMSDNAATDVLLRRLGLDAVRAVLAELGLSRTSISGGCAELFARIRAELGLRDDGGDIDASLVGVSTDAVWRLSALDPARTYASAPREIGALLAAIWQDRAGPPAACAELRSMLARQIWPHRMAAGFPDGVTVAGKTGTILAVRNEAGVVTLPDGRGYTVAVFTRAERLDERRPALDAAIGVAARLAVEYLGGTPFAEGSARLVVA
ncbi:serine hydrolase [Microtetraspora malaysiensis]|uniref:Serine hydrolase n=1 Tax=Microtetraspora malaysiensis TaxID=161358 RepID=A0ABW6T2C3_9ACTN